MGANQPRTDVITLRDVIVACFILEDPGFEVDGFNCSGVGFLITNLSILPWFLFCEVRKIINYSALFTSG